MKRLLYKHELIGYMQSHKKSLEEIIKPTVMALGFELWGCVQLAQGHHSVLKIFIDGPNGVGLDDCAQVSRQISALLDVEDPVKSSYTLEVSSPGLDRPLFTVEQYQRYLDRQVQLKLATPYQGRRNFSGVLQAIEENVIVVKADDIEHRLPLAHIAKANLVPVI